MDKLPLEGFEIKILIAWLEHASVTETYNLFWSKHHERRWLKLSDQEEDQKLFDEAKLE